MTTPTPPPVSTATRPRAWFVRVLRMALQAVAGLALAVVLILLGAWGWAGTEGSLAATLQSLTPGGG